MQQHLYNPQYLLLLLLLLLSTMTNSKYDKSIQRIIII
jgi:hypothetical protein